MATKPKIKFHVLVPKHTKLSDAEAKKVLETYNISVKDLPKIVLEDSAIAALNVKVGDVIKISRKSKTAGESVYYRGVING
ncbi:MAG: DNA-directed RNA polymerase subunit H [Candidatus Woesearchaeota archaeon]